MVAILKAEIPHFSIPFRFMDTRVSFPVKGPNQPPGGTSDPPSRDILFIKRAAVEEQDETQEIFNCIEVILRYPKGFREDDPEFGTPDQLFKMGGPNRQDILSAIEKNEDRMRASVEIDDQSLDALISYVSIELAEKGDTGGAVS